MSEQPKNTAKTKRPSIITVFHLDEVLKDFGSFGKFQSQRIFILLLVLYSFSIGGYNFLFATLIPEYRCLIPECENYTQYPLEYKPEWLENAVPFQKEKPEKCTRYEPQLETIQECSANSFNINKTKICDTYVFKDNSFKGIAQDFDIYCDDKLWMLTLPSTMSFVGLLISLPFNGYFSDRFGRKRTLILLIFITGCIAEIQAFFSYNYFTYISTQFLVGLVGSGVFPITYTLLLELLGPEYRSLGSFAVFSISVLGEATLALIAMHVSHWRTMVKISTFPALLVVLYGWLIQESIRWLLAKDKIGKANNAIKKMFEGNGVTLEMEKYQTSKPKTAEYIKEKQETFTDLFRSCPMVLRILTCMFCWISCVFVFYGITLGSVSIFGNLYLNFMMVALIEIPGNLAALIFSNKIGRKMTLSGSFIIAGLSCVGFTVIPGESWLKLLTYLLGKCAITSAFNCIYIYTTELYPTPFRQRVMGICSSVGRIGSIVAPQMPFLARIWTPLPYLIFACMAISGGLLTLIFPETLNTTLPDSIDSALNIGKSKNDDKLGTDPSVNCKSASGSLNLT
ncbi:organic cation transporter protein-like [Chrysoperla carnea]|uniref:organic cation transporter protein-like n=1 Tax=Chrysoperla carnea TaxID=189513 RepID=UPI001D070D5A|nr:organic cation transporter protein-like [Chrysoperla carnea]